MDNDQVSLDLISNLPLDIIRHIISFLPLKEAVRSISLSTLWNQVLAPINVKLEGSTIDGGDEAGFKEIEQVFGGFLSSYNSPQLLCLGKVVFATKGVENELHLNFFDQSTTTTTPFHLKLHTKNTLKNANFSSLRTLHLCSVNSKVINLVSELFKGFHLLQSLKVEKCVGLEELHVDMGNSLHSLVVLDCNDILSLTISAPNLKSFRYCGVVLPRIMQLENTSFLVEVSLELDGGVAGGGEFDCEEVLSLLNSLKDVQTLTLSGWLLEWMCRAGVIFGRLEFQFNKLEKLCWIGSSMDKAKRDSLACFLNICPSLVKLSIEMNHSQSSIACPFFHHYWHEPHLWMDYETVKSNTSQLKHLKMFSLEGFLGEEDEVLLMELLLNKAVVLESMTIA
ncbi:F-box protein At2g39490-like [Humulus lupulus]|uniref:F-box protein At2g39490-like n=1 Tax=Humulus lupulus TaxID=3486 RepID=UPI002B40D642|nr:F-box protein At2g39490-like [Humulus lupulus]